jgi:hypothetical protein
MRSAIILVAALCAAVPASAQSSKAWIDVNFGAAAAAEQSLSTESNIVDLDGEVETYRVAYRFPAGAEFDFGGGLMFSRVFGFGVQFTGTAHQNSADLFIRIPHPRFFDAYATDSGATDRKLQRTEGGVNLSLVALVRASPNVQLRLYGGPTYFRLEADAVQDIRYAQQFGLFTRANSVEITTWASDKVEETGWGFHAGADLGYFFSRHFGVGGFARFTRGTVTFTTEEFFVSEDIDVKVGGFQAGGGLRIRF